MRARGDDPRTLSAILITHEHSDHVYGLAVLARKFQVPVFMTGATHQAWARTLRDDAGELPQLARLEVFSAGRSFHVGDMAITPILSDSPSALKESKSASPLIWDTCRPTYATSCVAATCW